MATGIGAWDTTAANNDDADTDINWAEGQAPSTVNNSARAMMAAVATWLRDGSWIQLKEHTHTYVSATSVKTSGVDTTAYYPKGRRVRAVGSTTGTIYGRIVSATFSTDTTIVIKWDSGSLSNETLAVSVALAKKEACGGDLTGVLNTAKATDVASASSTDIWATNGNLVHVTGTTTIADFGTAPQAGCWRLVIFDGALTLTHGASAIVLPGSANITTAANDLAFVWADTTTKHYVMYQKADGTATVSTNASFSAHKNGTDQTGISSATETKMTAGTEVWDVGGYYDAANSKWTPPAGKVRLSAYAYFTAGIVDQALYLAVIYKNGSALRYGPAVEASGTSTTGVFVDILDDANGTDYYEVYVSGNGAGNKTIVGTASLTYFQGHQI